MKVLMARHGQTDSNVEGRVMGQRLDDPLNEAGLQQARELGESARSLALDVIFSSPLKRAHQTAEIVSHYCNAPIILRDELKERDYGSLSGKTWKEIEAFTKTKPGELRAIDIDQKYDYRPYDGESAANVQERLLGCLSEIKNTYLGKQVLIITHRGILRMSHSLFYEMKIEDIKNAAIEEFDV